MPAHAGIHDSLHLKAKQALLFVNKKKQKNFGTAGSGTNVAHARKTKGFFAAARGGLLFFKKAPLAWPFRTAPSAGPFPPSAV
jgi:hypothetical protein